MSRKRTTTTRPTPEQEIATLRAQLASLARDNESLAADNARLAAEAAESAAVAASMSDRVGELEAKMARLVEMIKLANLRFFAPRSERVPDDQLCLSLFNDAEAWADPTEPEPEPVGGDGAAPGPRRRGGRRRIDTSALERVVVEHDLEDRACPACGSEMSHMKVEVTEVIRLVPAHLVVEEHRRHVYRCKSCCDANTAGEVVSRMVHNVVMLESAYKHHYGEEDIHHAWCYYVNDIKDLRRSNQSVHVRIGFDRRGRALEMLILG